MSMSNVSQVISELKLELVDDESIENENWPGHWGAMAWYKVYGNSRNLIGDQSGFDLTIDLQEETVRYQLFTPLVEPESDEERVPVLLLRRTATTLTVLGRVTLTMEKVADWATNLLVQDLQKEELTGKELLAAGKLVTSDSSDLLAQGVLKQLEELAETGLHKVYASHDDYLCDLAADLPWEETDRVESLKWLLSPEGGLPRLEAAAKRIESKGGPDYLAMFQESLASPYAGESGRSVTQTDPRWKSRN